MLQESFILLPGVKTKTEFQLWSQNIKDWNDIIESKSISSVSKERLLFWKSRIRQAQQLLEKEDSGMAFAKMLGTRHIWRLYRHVMDSPRYLDIETTEYRTDITVVGISDGEFYQAFVKGRNLSAYALRQALRGASCIITFNGSSFDLPIIDQRFAVIPQVPHLDLRHICAQAQLYGGLKRIEKHLCIRRAAAVREKDGADAILLWHSHLLGEQSALNELVDYNAADVLNLAALADKVIPALWQHVRYGEPLPFSPMIRQSIT